MVADCNALESMDFLIDKPVGSSPSAQQTSSIITSIVTDNNTMYKSLCSNAINPHQIIAQTLQQFATESMNTVIKKARTTFIKKPRGRPPLTDEEKEEREKIKQQKKLL